MNEKGGTLIILRKSRSTLSILGTMDTTSWFQSWTYETCLTQVSAESGEEASVQGLALAF